MFPTRNRLISAMVLLTMAGGTLLVFRPWERTGPSDAATGVSASTSTPAPVLHPVVGEIVRAGPEMPYLKFNYLIKELPVTLADCDVEALVGFIRGPRPGGFSEAQWGSLVNDIEEALTTQSEPRPAVADALIAIYQDVSSSQMQRDYALQHIGGMAIYLVHTRGPSVADPVSPAHAAIFDRLLAELKSAAADGSKPWAGTAFNLLDGLLRAAEYNAVEIPGLDPGILAELSMPVARDETAPLNARLPALQVAARRGAPGALDFAREVLADPAANLMLVQSAAAVVGRLGGGGDIPLLEHIASTGGPHQAPAAREALRQLRAPGS